MNSKMVEICGYLVCAFIALLGAKILVLIWTDEINLKELLSEANGDASMSRLQLLIFTFVIAISLFMMVEKNGFFPWISDGVLTLLGISGSTYAAGKHGPNQGPAEERIDYVEVIVIQARDGVGGEHRRVLLSGHLLWGLAEGFRMDRSERRGEGVAVVREQWLIDDGFMNDDGRRPGSGRTLFHEWVTA